MLTKISRALRWTQEKLENLLAALAANYTRELLAAHGLVEIEIDHIRRNFKVEPDVAPIESEKIHRFIPSNENPPPHARPEVPRVQGAPSQPRKLSHSGHRHPTAISGSVQR
jgi:hypothetical protein